MGASVMMRVTQRRCLQSKKEGDLKDPKQRDTQTLPLDTYYTATQLVKLIAGIAEELSSPGGHSECMRCVLSCAL